MKRTRWSNKCRTCGADLNRYDDKCDVCKEVDEAVKNAFKAVKRAAKGKDT